MYKSYNRKLWCSKCKRFRKVDTIGMKILSSHCSTCNKEIPSSHVMDSTEKYVFDGSGADYENEVSLLKYPRFIRGIIRFFKTF